MLHEVGIKNNELYEHKELEARLKELYEGQS